MDNITVLVTGAGAPGIKGTLYSLKNNFDNRKVTIIGTDIQSEVVGKYICDKFYRIARPNNLQYLEQLLSICKKHKKQTSTKICLYNVVKRLNKSPC